MCRGSLGWETEIDTFLAHRQCTIDIMSGILLADSSDQTVMHSVLRSPYVSMR
jgi:hypothetical protein